MSKGTPTYEIQDFKFWFEEMRCVNPWHYELDLMLIGDRLCMVTIVGTMWVGPVVQEQYDIWVMENVLLKE